MNRLPFRLVVTFLAFVVGVALFNFGKTYNEMVEETQRARLIQSEYAPRTPQKIPGRLAVIDDTYGRRCGDSRPVISAAKPTRKEVPPPSPCHYEWEAARKAAVEAEAALERQRSLIRR